MGEDDRQTLTLRPRRWKMALYCAISAGFTVGGVFMIRNGVGKGWFVAGFFGACMLVFLALLMPGAAYLQLTRDGFRVRSLWRSHFTPWSAVAGFGVVRISHRAMVSYNFTDVAAHRGARFSRALTGAEGALPDSYGMSAQDLAALMTAWRARALAVPRPTEE